MRSGFSPLLNTPAPDGPGAVDGKTGPSGELHFEVNPERLTRRRRVEGASRTSTSGDAVTARHLASSMSGSSR